MSETAKIIDPESFNVRRFQEADLRQHGGWIMQRLIERFPHHNERFMAGWLTQLIVSNEYLFLYQNHAVGLAQRVFTHTLDAMPIVQERFVFAEDAQNALHVQAAASMYGEFHRWAKSQGIDKIIVEEMTDVPHDQIKPYLGRLFTTQIIFARV